MTDERFARHDLIPGWEQPQLTAASVIVMGMGALGNEVSRILAMAGVGKLILCDSDRIERSNLSRTVLFREEDIGQLKVDAAARSLQRLAPNIEIDRRPLPLAQGVGLAEIRDASLVMGCLDSRSSRLQLAGRCQLVGGAYIDGGTQPWGGEVQPFLVADGPCYSCGLTEEERGISDVPWSCLDAGSETPVGAAIPSSALVGTWMGMIAIRFLLGQPVPEKILKIDGVQGTTALVAQTRDPHCPMHRSLGAVTTVAVGSTDKLETLRAALPENAVIYVREPVQCGVDCRNCGFQAERWQIPRVENCPQCDRPLLPRTTLTLEQAPDHLRLRKMGIPPREILPVKIGTEFIAIELMG